MRIQIRPSASFLKDKAFTEDIVELTRPGRFFLDFDGKRREYNSSAIWEIKVNDFTLLLVSIKGFFQ